MTVGQVPRFSRDLLWKLAQLFTTNELPHRSMFSSETVRQFNSPHYFELKLKTVLPAVTSHSITTKFDTMPGARATANTELPFYTVSGKDYFTCSIIK